MNLTARQLACLRLAADGLTYASIGRQLGFTAHAVKANLSAAAHQLDATSTIHAVGIAYRTGLLDVDVDREQVALVRLAQSMGRRIALVPVGESA